MALLVVVSVLAVFTSKPAHLYGQQAPDAQQHEQHHPNATEPAVKGKTGQPPEMARMMAAMNANDLKLDELVNTMKAAQGSAKVDAVADLLTLLVEDRRTMHETMRAHMSIMMKNMMGK
jgi:hypothetical protein